MKEQLISAWRHTGADLLERVEQAAHHAVSRHHAHRLERGLRHGQGDYTGLLDRIRAGTASTYSLEDIRRGYIDEEVLAAGNTVRLGSRRVPLTPPTSHYLVGRYMAQGNRLLANAQRNGDVEAALCALGVFRWLGQDRRASVRNRVSRVYAQAKELSEQYRVPLSDLSDRRTAILPSAVHYEVEQYLRAASPPQTQ